MSIAPKLSNAGLLGTSAISSNLFFILSRFAMTAVNTPAPAPIARNNGFTLIAAVNATVAPVAPIVAVLYANIIAVTVLVIFNATNAPNKACKAIFKVSEFSATNLIVLTNPFNAEIKVREMSFAN